ncbi:MAG: hybrid sensor histidine kinase/response regulator [Proteobacteria bacterium]|nr:hybrid sensor histidine kinase/response regulator [Pseudomonadota bacterium]
MHNKNKILIVDDNLTNQKVLKVILASDYDLETADSGEEALEKVYQFSPDMVLLDIMMPGIDGYEVCRRIRADESISDTKILLISAKAMLDDRLKGYDVGADDYITKPFEDMELLAKVGVFSRLIGEERKRKRTEEELKASMEEMQALSETGALVARVAHDAKKFTTAMSMSMEGLVIPLLKEHLVQSDDWVIDLMNDVIEMHSNSVQCTGFLESLLAINRKNEIVEPISSVEVVKQAISLLSYSLMQEGIQWSLDLDFESGRQMMVLGTNQLIRVFMNLIANASDALKKYETDNPRISINIAEKENEIQIRVHDNGPGIKPDILEGIRKGMVVSTKGKGGNGFGVSGATKIVKNCNGIMDVESRLGKGATFIVSLPKAPDETEVKEDVDLEGVDLF